MLLPHVVVVAVMSLPHAWADVATPNTEPTGAALHAVDIRLDPTWAGDWGRLAERVAAFGPNSRLCVPAFEGGVVYFPPKSVRPPGCLTASPTRVPWPLLRKECRARGVQLMGAFDLLDWHGASDEALDAAGLLELRALRSEPVGSSTPYAAVGARHLAPALSSMARTFGLRCRPDGLMVTCRLRHSYRETDVLGYSDASRLAYVRAASIDPLDILLDPVNEGDLAYVNEWLHWREDRLTDVVAEVTTGFRAACPRGTVSVRGYVDTYDAPRQVRLCLAENWMAWLNRGCATDLVLHTWPGTTWADRVHRGSFRRAKLVTARLDPPVVPQPELGSWAPLTEATCAELEFLVPEGACHATFVVRCDEDLALLQRVLAGRSR
ncbi:MAG: hypothetical protein FJX74_02580 [Armatimonadetes bacterium]|nr:hypothetical protein [Armatimonadota bacterium]